MNNSRASKAKDGIKIMCEDIIIYIMDDCHVWKQFEGMRDESLCYSCIYMFISLSLLARVFIICWWHWCWVMHTDETTAENAFVELFEIEIKIKRLNVYVGDRPISKRE